MAKYVEKKEFLEIRMKLRDRGKTIALCHGVFDLIHPGHIIHFQEAKKMADVLVVSITSEEFVRKGPGRPYFNNNQRITFLEAIECIDYILISESYTVEDIIPVVKPDFYVKGAEYADASKDVTGGIIWESGLVEKYGGKLVFTGGEVFSSTRLINNSFNVFSPELKNFLSGFSKRHNIEELRNLSEKAKQLKVLVVGDIIIDDYVFCKVQGLMSKNIGYSARFVSEEKYYGGSVAIARHLSSFCSNVTLLSICGNEQDIMRGMEETCDDNVKLLLHKDSYYSTIIKKRYVEADDKRNELNKIMVINNVTADNTFSKENYLNFKQELRNIVSNYDAVFLCDFGHGLIDAEVMDIIQNNAMKIVLNCQTNSTNYGLNPITKYKKADFFSLDEKELKLAYRDYTKNGTDLLPVLAKDLKGSGWLTVGSKGAIGVTNEGDTFSVPAFVLDVRDTIGAGDAFYSIAGIFALAGADIELSSFMGNVAGALTAEIDGNKENVKYADIMKYASTLLNI